MVIASENVGVIASTNVRVVTSVSVVVVSCGHPERVGILKPLVGVA